MPGLIPGNFFTRKIAPLAKLILFAIDYKEAFKVNKKLLFAMFNLVKLFSMYLLTYFQAGLPPWGKVAKILLYQGCR